MIPPRGPTPEEVQAITTVVSIEQGIPPEEVADLLSRSGVAVFDNYISDGPGFTGNIAIIVWPGGVELVTTLAFTKAGRIYVS